MEDISNDVHGTATLRPSASTTTYVTKVWSKSTTRSCTVPRVFPSIPHTEDPIRLETREGFFSPVTGTLGVVVISGAVVGASVAVASLVLVDSTVMGGTFVLGTLVDVSCPPQATSSNAARTNIVVNKLTLLILINLLSFLSLQTDKLDLFPLSIFCFDG
jgi:hypothetical protein